VAVSGRWGVVCRVVPEAARTEVSAEALGTGLFSLAIGLLIRHTAGGIATVIGVVLVLPILTSLLPGRWGAHIDAYLPEQAGSKVYGARPEVAQLLSAWEGFGIFCLWTLVLLALGAWLLRRRDA